MSLATILRRPEKQAAIPQPALETSAPSAHKNLMSTRDGVWAWFVMGPQRWEFTSLEERDIYRGAVQLRYADLAGYRIHLRVLPFPTNYRQWAAQFDHASPDHLPDVEGAETWADLLGLSQSFMRDNALGTSRTYLGVRLSKRAASQRTLERVADGQEHGGATIARLRKALTDVTGTVAGDGMGALPLSGRALGFLLHSSRAIGVPVSPTAFAGVGDTWEAADLDGVHGQAHVTALPYGSSVKVSAQRDGRSLTRHVAVCTLGAMGSRDTDNMARDPWISFSQSLPFPVEWSAILDVVPPAELAESARLTRLRAKDQAEHYEDFGEDPPRPVELQIEAAKRVQDEVTSQPREEATRLSGQWRMALYAADVEKLGEQVKYLKSQYNEKQKITVEEVKGQLALYDEFTPGNGRAENGGHVRNFSVQYAALAVPNASASLGDGVGGLLGYTVGNSREPVHFSPTYGPQHDHSGLIVGVGALGSGKSTLLGYMAELEVMSGHRTILNDPSGPLAALCRLPHLAKHSRHIELSSATPGLLNPYHLVPDPLRESYEGEREHRAAIASARAERFELVVDTFLDLIDPETRRQSGVRAAIRAAASPNSVDPDYHQNPWNVVEALSKDGELGKMLAQQLTVASEFAGAALIFPQRMDDERDEVLVPLDSATLTVLTTAGLPQIPAGAEPSTTAEFMVKPITHLATRYASRAMYSDRHSPKFIGSDETGQSGGRAGAYRQFFTRGAIDSRKWGAGFAVFGQNSSHFTAISDQIANLAGVVLVGRMKEAEAAREAVKLLEVPGGHGYEGTPLNFPTGNTNPRHFLMRDWDGRVGVFEALLDHRPALKLALNTTPNTGRGRLVSAADEYDNLAEIA